MRRRHRFVLLAALLFALPVSLQAHRAGESYIFLRSEEHGLSGRVEVTLTDIASAVPLDTDRDGRVTVPEFEAGYEKVRGYVRERVALRAEGRDLELDFDSHSFYESSFGTFAQLHFTVLGSAPPPDVVDAEYRVLLDAIPEHVAYLVVEANYRTGLKDNEMIPSIVFTLDRPRYQTDLTQPLTPATFLAFLRQGIRHTWIEIDHIFFVLALVMVSPLRRQGLRWEPVAGLRPALINVAKILVLFAIAHSVTLGLATLGFVRMPPPRVVESVIALSVALAAMNNVYPIFNRFTWDVVFVFGLFHGFGFASVLSHLNAAREAILRTLLGFNLGVEIGQLAVVAVVFPVVFILRSRVIYNRIVLRVGSLAIAAIACVWFLERAFE